MDELAIFERALDLNDPEERAAYVEDACGEDAELRSRIEALLRSHEQAGSFLQGGASAAAATIDQPIAEKPGTVIGPYKLLQQIGEGGFGVVFMADQTKPVKRRVALKIIKPGMDTQQVIARFEAERQALAMMDHPNIAKILDAGTTDSGRPYFVMELVKGIPITKYCDAQHLTPKQRLDMFIPVCQAVQHAHQKGIIHRDLKPSNVLIALYDNQPVPKVIDFGVAKATSQKLTEKTMFTHYGQIVGTVEYMSPEQANLNQLDIDTRSDIYSLGVLLYELLTGNTPFDCARLRSAAFEEMLRIIREEEPPKPSLRLNTSESLPSIAANRHIEPKKLSTLVRGELDWIVMKALEKDRARRYETANSFANDIQRYLSDEAVVACPPSRAYRFRKFARRNKMALATGSVVVAALLLGLVGTTWQMFRATKAEQLAQTRYGEAEAARRSEAEQRQVAEHRRAEAEAQRNRAKQAAARAEEEAEKARTEAAIAQAVNDFLNKDMLSQADPSNEPDREIKLRTVVDRASEKIAGRFEEQPLVEAAIRQTLGSTYRSLGKYEEAERHAKRALEICRRVLGDEHPDTLTSMNGLALLYHLWWARLDETEALYEKTLDIRRRVLGDEHPDTLTSMHNLAALYWSQSRNDEAEALFDKTLEIERRVLGEQHPTTLSSMHGLARLYTQQGRYDEAEALFDKTLEIERRVLGEEHPKTLHSMHGLAELYTAQGRYEEAEVLYDKTLEIRRRVLGEEHNATLWSIRGLLGLYAAQSRHDEALAGWNRYVGHKTFDDPTAALIRAQLLLMTDRTEEYRQACVAILDRFAQSERPAVFGYAARACVLAPKAIPDPMVPVELAARAVSRLPMGWTLYTLGMAHFRAGQLDEAAQRFHQSLSAYPNWTARFLNWLGLALVQLERGETEEARQWLGKAIESMEQHLAPFPQDRIEGQLLRREAEQLLGKPEPESDAAKSEQER